MNDSERSGYPVPVIGSQENLSIPFFLFHNVKQMCFHLYGIILQSIYDLEINPSRKKCKLLKILSTGFKVLVTNIVIFDIFFQGTLVTTSFATCVPYFLYHYYFEYKFIENNNSFSCTLKCFSWNIRRNHYLIQLGFH